MSDQGAWRTAYPIQIIEQAEDCAWVTKNDATGLHGTWATLGEAIGWAKRECSRLSISQFVIYYRDHSFDLETFRDGVWWHEHIYPAPCLFMEELAKIK